MDEMQDLKDLVQNFEAIAPPEVCALAWHVHGMVALLDLARDRCGDEIDDFQMIASLMTSDLVNRLGITEQQTNEALKFAKVLAEKAGHALEKDDE